MKNGIYKGKVFYRYNKPYIDVGKKWLPLKNKKNDTIKEGDIISAYVSKNIAFLKKTENQESYKIYGVIDSRGDESVFCKSLDLNFKTDFFIPPQNRNGNLILHGDIVYGEITQWPHEKNPHLRVINTIDNKHKIDIILSQYMPFDLETLSEASTLHLSNQDLKQNREDLTHVQTITIDPKGSKDFDDALSIEKKEDGYSIGIHISDVSSFIQPGTRLDLEAFKRGTTTYFPHHVSPMFPEQLSNDIFSLKENKESLALSIIFETDKNLKIKFYEILSTVIQVNQNISYDESEKALKNENHDISEFIQILKDFGEKNTPDNNKVNLYAPEYEIEFSNGEVLKPLKLNIKKVLKSHIIIENLMILANNTIANELNDDGIFRVHEEPYKNFFLDNDFQELINKFNPNFKLYGDIKNDLLKIKHPFLVKKAMSKLNRAFYSPYNQGHWGLGLNNYCHFTSPIRRYSDIINHRIIKNKLQNRKNITPVMEKTCEWLNKREQISNWAEKEAFKYWQLYLLKEVDYQLWGMANKWVKGGLIVYTEFEVEGFLPFDELKKLKKKINIGDTLKVYISKLDIEKRRLILCH